jgi:predicted O-methyltransferase YrrM
MDSPRRSSFALVAEQDLSPDNAWYRHHAYDPPFLRVISNEDHQTLIDWHTETKATYPNAGASGVEMMTMLTGLVMSTGITRMVQCGHYVGFSTLLLGMIARQMGLQRSLYTVDIDPESTAYTRKWIEKVGFAEDIMVALHDSSDPICAEEARAFLGGEPQLVYIDSSHNMSIPARN